MPFSGSRIRFNSGEAYEPQLSGPFSMETIPAAPRVGVSTHSLSGRPSLPRPRLQFGVSCRQCRRLLRPNAPRSLRASRSVDEPRETTRQTKLIVAVKSVFEHELRGYTSKKVPLPDSVVTALCSLGRGDFLQFLGASAAAAIFTVGSLRSRIRKQAPSGGFHSCLWMFPDARERGKHCLLRAQLCCNHVSLCMQRCVSHILPWESRRPSRNLDDALWQGPLAD